MSYTDGSKYLGITIYFNKFEFNCPLTLSREIASARKMALIKTGFTM